MKAAVERLDQTLHRRNCTTPANIAGFGIEWIVLPLSVAILLAVGSDYNLLVVSRLKEEIHAGLNTESCAASALPVVSSRRPAWCSPSPWPQ
jgi:hypothetical protein